MDYSIFERAALAVRFVRRAGVALAMLGCFTVHAAPLAPAEAAAVFEAAGLTPRDGAYAIEGCASLLKPQTESLALESGKHPGVLVYLGRSSCFAETQGGNVALFVRGDDGRWQRKLDFVPGVEVVRQPTSNLGWPDLGVANPGGCMPIYRFNGSDYERHSQKALQPGGCQFRQ
jgi:hypothetical protein